MVVTDRKAVVQRNIPTTEQRIWSRIYHSTKSIKLNPKDYLLFVTRCYAFKEVGQFYLAMQDALMLIKMLPDYYQGYRLKAELEFATFQFAEAIDSYCKVQSFEYHSDIRDAICTATRELFKDRRADQQIPWLGAGIGLILGVSVVMADYVFNSKPTLTHPLLMALLTISIAMLGFSIAKGFRYFVKCQRKALMKPVPEIEIERLINENYDEAVNEYHGIDDEPRTRKRSKKKTCRREIWLRC